MQHSKKIKYFLVHTLRVSYDDAQALLDSRKISIGGSIVTGNVFLDDTLEVKCGDEIIREQTIFHYFLLNKPRGIECTFNPEIPDNILPFIPGGYPVFPVGRLDKLSEGLLLLTNDGKLGRHILQDGVEKEYEVEVDQKIDEEFRKKMAGGVKIMGQMTKPCTVEVTGENTFRILLTQGLNRQIRRMCYKCGVEVTKLKRVRIGNFLLGEIPAGESWKVENMMAEWDKSELFINSKFRP